jgi:hypothetical protein
VITVITLNRAAITKFLALPDRSFATAAPEASQHAEQSQTRGSASYRAVLDLWLRRIRGRT